MSRRVIVLAALLLLVPVSLVPASVYALDLSGVHFDDHATLDGTPLVLNGAGVRHVTIFGIEVYVAGLYLPARTTDAADILRADHTRELVVVMRRDAGRDQIGPAFRDAITHAAGSSATALRAEIDAFGAWVPAMHEHDRLVVSYTPAAGLVVTATSATTTFHGSADLAAAVFGMWIGPHAVEDGLRDGLLGR